MELPHLYELFPVTSPEVSRGPGGPGMSLPAALAELDLSNDLVISSSEIPSAISSSETTSGPSIQMPMPTCPLEQAYQVVPRERLTYNHTDSAVAVPFFGFLMEDDLEPRVQPSAWPLFASSMLQALSPVAQIEDALEEVATVRGSMSPRVTYLVESAENETVPSNFHGPELAQEFLGELFTKVESGKTPQSLYDAYEPVRPSLKPTTIESLNIESLQDSEILFFFGVFAMMAKLNPKYQFKHGGLGGEMVGMKLTLYGYTVFVEPNSDSANEARVLGSKRALVKLQEDYSQWPVPPEPNSGYPAGPEWNWPILLKEFCETENWSLPCYSPRLYGSITNTEWHCDVSVNGRVFRTGCPSNSREQAQNTAAHIALHTVFVHANITPEFIKAADDPCFEFKKEKVFKFNSQKETSADTVSITPSMPDLPARNLNSDTPAGIMDSMEAAFVSGRSRSSRGKGKGRKAAQKKIAKKGPKPVKALTPPKLGHDSNLIPLTKSRLAPLVIKPVVVEDRLARLKKMQQELGGTTTECSYRTLLAHMCSVLKVNLPDIRHEKNPDDSSPTGWMIRAWFDLEDPYLSRASPIMLATTPKMNERVANSLGVKKLMLYLLRMTQEDAGITSLDPCYVKDFPFLKALEVEIEQRLMKDDEKWSN
ncbi:uncharacterized protein N7484_011849 [Penicillium longicatenatum]|uniref:uncharacterized protein n=1 Tax=Penicillium longicatenatum TaxID=1561947 RepID=UPI002549C108|nr:uncharacterized protein N7484_011849 [Penicillium longicatenatum]KAJ5631749.1 hypothetical protein N7484_011849 [Penicillium longicatenatum]